MSLLKGLAAVFGGTVLLAGVTVGGYEAAVSQRILANVRIEGQPVGGMTLDQARRRARAATADLAQVPVVVTFEGRQWSTKAGELGYHYDIESAARQAFRFGHGTDVWSAIGAQLALLRQPADVDVSLQSDSRGLDAWVRSIASAVDRPVENADLSVAGTTVTIVPGQSGRHVDQAALKEQITESVAAEEHSAIPAPVVEDARSRTEGDLITAAAQLSALLAGGPVQLTFGDKSWILSQQALPPQVRWQLPPAPAKDLQVSLDQTKLRPEIERIAASVNRPPKNAVLGWDGKQVTIVQPSEEGRQVDVAATLQAVERSLTQRDRKAQLAVATQEPAISAHSLASLGLKELVSEGKSNFSFSPPERVVNVRKMASLLNGVLIAPGDIFSFNAVMGDISPEAGWAEGLVINDGRTVPGLGGGICQVSTTAFRGAFWAGLPIIERHDHAYPVPYYTQGGYPEGFDATVWSPDLDLKFKNDTPGYLLIQTSIDFNTENLTVSFYGTKVPNRTVQMAGPYVWNVKPAPPAKRIPNPSLPKGAVKQTDWSHQGMDVLVKRIVTDAAGSRTDDFTSHYQPWAAVYEVGPSDPAAAPSPAPAASSANPPAGH